jgi:hypothetical protein
VSRFGVDFSTTRRYVHPQADTIRQAIERARNAQSGAKSAAANATEALPPAAAETALPA